MLTSLGSFTSERDITLVLGIIDANSTTFWIGHGEVLDDHRTPSLEDGFRGACASLLMMM